MNVKHLGNSFYEINYGKVVVVKKSKKCISVWDGGWRALCAPGVGWAFVVQLMKAMER